LSQKIDAHSDKASHVVLGQSYNGEDIVGISIGDASRPVFYLHCGIHAREWITVTTCLWIVDQLLDSDPERDKLTALFRWVLIPVHNVDGYDYTHTTSRLWRKNRAPNSGSTCIGTDVNRNYAYAWDGPGSSTNPCSDTYRGSAPFSTPEAMAENAYLSPLMNAGNLGAYIDIHAYGAMFMSPWAWTTTLPTDYTTMNAQMTAATAAIQSVNGNRYAMGSIARTIYVASGSTVDFTYSAGEVTNSYAIECFGSSFTPPVSSILPIGKEIWAGVRSVALRIVQ